MNIFSNICPVIFFVFGIPTVMLVLFTTILFKVVQKKYIFRRFREETNLSEMKAIHITPITKYLADSWFPMLYTTHLFIIIIIGDNLFQKFPLYSDLGSRQDVLKHFSWKEIIWTVVIGGAACMCCILMIVGSILLVLNPECRN